MVLFAHVICKESHRAEMAIDNGPLPHPVGVALARSIEIKLRLLVFGFMLNTRLNSRRCRNEKSRLFTHCQSDAHGSYNGHLSLPSSNWQRV